MRQQGNNQRRPRGRANRKPPLSPRSQNFESNGPDVRVRGNAHQVHEKYLNLARDAAAAGDRIAAESYFQFAEHYFRLLNDSTDPQRQGPRDRAPQHHRDGRPQGPPSEQPVVDMGYQPVAEGTPVHERPRGPRTNGHDSSIVPVGGDGAPDASGPNARGSGRPAETVEAEGGKRARAEQTAVASVPAAQPSEGSEQPIPEQPVSGAKESGPSGVGPEKRPPAKRRVGRPRRKPTNGEDGKPAGDVAARGADATAEQNDEEPSQDQPDNDTVTP